MARQSHSAYGSFLGFFARTELIAKGSDGSRPGSLEDFDARESGGPEHHDSEGL